VQKLGGILRSLILIAVMKAVSAMYAARGRKGNRIQARSALD